MADNRALSQWEIDALLNQIPDGAANEPEPSGPVGTIASPGERSTGRSVKAYDFRRPDKFSKEQWATLQSMHETFARLVGAAFSSRLRSLATVRLSSIDQGLYEEWQAQVPTQTACYVLSMEPLRGNIVIEFNDDVSSEVIDRLLGGTGVLLDRGRDMTEVELGLLRSFATAITGPLEEMWTGVQQVYPELQDLGQDASLIQVAGPTDVVLTAFFEVNVGNHLGAMSICVPYTVLEPIVGKLSAHVWMSGGYATDEATQAERRLMEVLVERSDLAVEVELGSAMLPAHEVADLREGDTIVLDARVGRPMDIVVGGRARLTGLPGVVDGHVALQVTDVLLDDEDLPEVPDRVERLGLNKTIRPAAEPEQPDSIDGTDLLGAMARTAKAPMPPMPPPAGGGTA